MAFLAPTGAVEHHLITMVPGAKSAAKVVAVVVA